MLIITLIAGSATAYGRKIDCLTQRETPERVAESECETEEFISVGVLRRVHFRVQRFQLWRPIPISEFKSSKGHCVGVICGGRWRIRAHVRALFERWKKRMRQDASARK